MRITQPLIQFWPASAMTDGISSNFQFPYCATYRSTDSTSTFQGYQCAAVSGLIISMESTFSRDSSDSTQSASESEIEIESTTSIDISTITETYLPSESVTAAPIVNNNFYDNSSQTNNINGGETKESSSSGKGGSGISKGELAGIIVGSVAAFATIVGVLVACCCR